MTISKRVVKWANEDDCSLWSKGTSEYWETMSKPLSHRGSIPCHQKLVRASCRSWNHSQHHHSVPTHAHYHRNGWPIHARSAFARVSSNFSAFLHINYVLAKLATSSISIKEKGKYLLNVWYFCTYILDILYTKTCQDKLRLIHLFAKAWSWVGTNTIRIDR